MVDWVHDLGLGYTGVSVDSTAMDIDGSFFIAGSHVVAKGGTSSSDVFILKYDTATDKIAYITSFGGSDNDYVYATAIDSFGNLYVTGMTESKDFPDGPIDDGKPRSFLVRLNGADGAVQKTTLLPDRVYSRKLAIDAFGAVIIAGIAGPLDLPSFPGAAIPSPLTTVGPNDLTFFVAKYDLNQAKFLFATFLPPVDTTLFRNLIVQPSGDLLSILLDGTLISVNSSGTAINYRKPAPLRVQSATVDSERNLYIAGTTAAGVLAVQKLKPDGTAETEWTWKGDAPRLGAMTAIPGVGVHLFSGQPTAGFQTLNSIDECSIATGGLVMFNANGSVVNASYTRLSLVENSAAVSPVNRRIYALNLSHGLVRIHPGVIPPDKTTIGCVTHGASFAPVPLTPGALMTIFGNRLGPATGAQFALENGQVPTTLAATRITVNGQPAPILYAQDGQVNFAVPWSTLGNQTNIPLCLQTNSGESCRSLTTAATSPAAFRRDYVSSAALNQDLSANSQTNAAAKGSVVALYLTGAGLMEGPLVDGGVAGTALQRLPGAVAASVESPQVICGFMRMCPGPPIAADVLYAGSAPGLILGVVQVNVRVPTAMTGNGLKGITVKLQPDGPSFGANVWVQ